MNLEELAIAEINKNQLLFIWAKSRYYMDDKGEYIQAIPDYKYEPVPIYYNQNNYLELVNMGDDDIDLENFVNKYGLLGLSGWHYSTKNSYNESVYSQDFSKYPDSDGFVLEPRRKRRLLNSEPIVDYDGYGASLSAVEWFDLYPRSFLEIYYPHLKLDDFQDFNNTELSSREPVDEFIEEVWRFKSLYKLYANVTKCDVKLINDCIKEWKGLDFLDYLPEKIVKAKPDDARNIVAKCINIALAGVKPYIDDTFKWNYEVSPLPASLLHYFYIEFAFNFANGLFPSICGYKNCNRFFIPARPTQKYCTESCYNCAKVYRSRNKN